MPALLLFVLFIVVPIAEIYVIIQVGQAIGALPTVALLIADSILGSMLMRAQGRAAWRRFQEALAAGRVPARETLDGVLVIFGGAFLLTPGFLTDLCGVLLLLPPTRAAIRSVLVRRVTFGVLSNVPNPPRPGARRRRGPTEPDVEGSATEIDPRRLP